MDVSYESALEIAERLLDAEVRRSLDEEVVINLKTVQETPHFWVFFYNTRAFIETKSMVHSLAGNGPVLVEKATGRARIGRSDIDWPKQVGM